VQYGEDLNSTIQYDRYIFSDHISCFFSSYLIAFFYLKHHKEIADTLSSSKDKEKPPLLLAGANGAYWGETGFDFRRLRSAPFEGAAIVKPPLRRGDIYFMHFS